MSCRRVATSQTIAASLETDTIRHPATRSPAAPNATSSPMPARIAVRCTPSGPMRAATPIRFNVAHADAGAAVSVLGMSATAASPDRWRLESSANWKMFRRTWTREDDVCRAATVRLSSGGRTLGVDTMRAAVDSLLLESPPAGVDAGRLSRTASGAQPQTMIRVAFFNRIVARDTIRVIRRPVTVRIASFGRGFETR